MFLYVSGCLIGLGSEDRAQADGARQPYVDNIVGEQGGVQDFGDLELCTKARGGQEAEGWQHQSALQ